MRWENVMRMRWRVQRRLRDFWLTVNAHKRRHTHTRTHTLRYCITDGWGANAHERINIHNNVWHTRSTHTKTATAADAVKLPLLSVICVEYVLLVHSIKYASVLSLSHCQMYTACTRDTYEMRTTTFIWTITLDTFNQSHMHTHTPIIGHKFAHYVTAPIAYPHIHTMQFTMND